MQFSLEQIKEASKKRPQGYLEEFLGLAVKTDGNLYELSDENFAKLAKKYRLPSMIQMIENLTKAGVDAAQDPSLRTKEEMERNAEICSECPFLIVDSFRCGQCGCFLDIKLRLRIWKCPINKWPS
jgi:hypothetical protein